MLGVQPQCEPASVATSNWAFSIPEPGFGIDFDFDDNGLITPGAGLAEVGNRLHPTDGWATPLAGDEAEFTLNPADLNGRQTVSLTGVNTTLEANLGAGFGSGATHSYTDGMTFAMVVKPGEVTTTFGVFNGTANETFQVSSNSSRPRMRLRGDTDATFFDRTFNLNPAERTEVGTWYVMVGTVDFTGVAYPTGRSVQVFRNGIEMRAGQTAWQDIDGNGSVDINGSMWTGGANISMRRQQTVARWLFFQGAISIADATTLSGELNAIYGNIY